VLSLAGIVKRFGTTTAVDGIDLEVAPGELLALLGPSGCGKTTTLRLTAGFEHPDAGTVALRGEIVAGSQRFVPPERRRIGVVFQDYALFPHLSVADNVGYGVRERAGRTPRVAEMLDLVGLADEAHRRPHELSGGEQQRVAIARALAPDPTVVLLDEPFSNLDTALRVRVRDEVRDILTAAGATAVFVTHDQEEALSLADRVAVMSSGRLLQVGSPSDLYEQPADRFVATFVGDADLLPGEFDGTRIATALGAHRPTRALPQGPVEVVLRPEHLRLRLDGSGPGAIRRITYFGHDQVLEVALLDGARVHARVGPGSYLHVGDRVAVSVAGDVIAFPATPSTPTPVWTSAEP